MSLVRKPLTLVVGAAALLLLGVGWYYSSQALAVGGPRVPEFDLEIIDVDDATVLLPLTDDSLLEAVGLLPQSGDWYAQMVGSATPERCEAGMCVRRDYEMVFGSAPSLGEPVMADPYFFAPGKPELAVGAPMQTLQVQLDVGLAPAWWLPPSSGSVVVVAIHGRGASRDEMLRLASIVAPLGHGLLIPTHRGDGVAPDPADGIGRFGTSEWLDVALAMMHDAVPKDASFVLAGNSQGGAAVATLLAQGDIAKRVVGVILDSPLLGLDATMQLQASLAGIPSVMTRPVLASAYLVSRARGFAFADGEHVAFLADSQVPLLVFHGPGDTSVAHEPTDTLAQLRADVRYERTEGVEHVRFWNHDPSVYADAVRRFLDEELP